MNMGSMNFGLFPMLERFKYFEHDWERPYLEDSKDLIFRNTYGDIETALKDLSASGTRYEFECYDTSHLYNLAHFVQRGLVKAPFFVQTVFGILGGFGAHPDDVRHMKRTAHRLFDDDYRWSVLGAGRSQMKIAAMAASMGANVRIGLGDSLWIGAGKSAKSATFSRAWAWKLPRPTKRARFCSSKAATPSAFNLTPAECRQP